MYQNLRQSGKIASVTTKNRLVMSPMGIGMAELDGAPSDEMIAYYEARAKGGAGIVIPEITRINDVHGVGLMRQLSVTKDRHIAPLAKLATAVQRHGSKIFIQLHHPGRETMSALIGGQPVVAPSAIPCKQSQQETRALENAEVKALVQQFIDGAVRVQKAGCDGVQLHAAHGYLIQQFLSPYTNKRTDEYGGSFENRMRFITEIIGGIRAACGDFPLIVRLSVEEFLDRTGVTEDYIHLADGIQIAQALEKLGIDGLDVSCGLYETGVTSVEPTSYPQGWRRDMIKAVKDKISIPVIAVSVLREPAFADQFIADGVTDFVSMGRSWLADEDWGVKALGDREKEINKCISCMRCFESLSAYNAAGVPAECAVNPRCARELRYGDLVKDVSGNKAVVVGGGPAGMSAARTLAQRNVKVTLIEKGARLGGQICLAKEPPLKDKLDWMIQYYEYELERLGVDVQLNTTATAETVDALKPNGVIIATGGSPIVPGSIPGVDKKTVYSVEDVLSGASGLENKTIAVIGAGMTGIETAEYLCAKGNTVTIVDMLDKVAPDGYRTNVADVMGRLAKHGAVYMLGHALQEIQDGAVLLEEVATKAQKSLPADAVVLSLGLKPNNALATALEDKYPVSVIGDSVEIGRIAPAVRGGYESGKKMFVQEKPAPSFRSSEADLENFAKVSLMGDQKGVNMAFLTDMEAVARILPPPLKPYPMPIATLSVMHINDPSFAEDYYEAILGVYALCGNQMGQYCVSLILGGPGAEMATQLGREKSGIPKKLDAQFNIKRTGDTVTVSVARKGVQLVDATLELGEYNSPLTDVVYQGARAGKQTGGMGMYYLMDCHADEEGKTKFHNPKLFGTICQYDYHQWEPAFVTLKTNSSVDDPWGELPIRTIIGGAYNNNDLLMVKTLTLAQPDIDEVLPYLLQSRFDRSAFMEKGNI